MIEITKNGELNFFNGKCPKCGCEFTFDERDIKTEEFFDDAIEETIRYIDCPYCMHQINIDSDDVYVIIPSKKEEPKETPLNKIKKEILEYFDFDKVQTVMCYLDWQWAGCNCVPSTKEIKECAMRLVEEAYSNKSTVATGGFKAAYHFYEDTNEECVELSFYLDEAAPCVNKDTGEVNWY